MDIERNKAVVSELFSRLSASDLEGALALLADDATWWIAGKPGALPVAGTLSKEKLAGLLRRMLGRTKSGLRMTIKSMVAEGSRVAVEAESYGELDNGRVYNQEYHFAIVVEDGKIRTVREYLDTQHVLAVWFAT